VITEVDVNRWIMKALDGINVKVFSDNEIAVSEVGTPCIRRSYYQRIRGSLPTPVEFLKLLGTEVHKYLAGVLEEEGYRVEVGFKLKLREFYLIGRIDAIKEDAEDPYVVELKVVEDVPEEPYETHVLQVQAYILAAKADVGYLVYISRRNGRVKVFKVYKNRKALRKLIERAYILYKALKEKVPPPPEKGPWCNTCQFTLTCSKR